MDSGNPFRTVVATIVFLPGRPGVCWYQIRGIRVTILVDTLERWITKTFGSPIVIVFTSAECNVIEE
jgi:hypothetical protein